MTYPPGSPGYPPAQSAGSYAAPQPSFAKTDDGESKLKQYLTIAVVVLGLAVYLLNFGPMITRSDLNGDGSSKAGAHCRSTSRCSPRPAGRRGPAAQGEELLRGGRRGRDAGRLAADRGAPSAASGRGWALWSLWAPAWSRPSLAISALLLDAGVITPPAPRPKYDQYGVRAVRRQYGSTAPARLLRSARCPATRRTPSHNRSSPPATGPSTAVTHRPEPDAARNPDRSRAWIVPSRPSTDRPPRQRVSPASARRRRPAPAVGAGQFGSGQLLGPTGQHSFGQGQQPQAPSSPSGPSQS